MVEGSGAHQLCVAVNLSGYLCGEVSHLYGVVEGAGCLFAHAAENVLVGVRELDEGDVADESECLLDDVEQGVCAEDDDSTDEQIGVVAGVEGVHVAAAYQIDGEACGHGCKHEDGCRPEELGSAAQFAQGEDDGDASYCLDGNELEGVLQHAGADEHYGDMCNESRSRVHEHSYEDGHDGEGNDEDVEQAMADEQRRQQREEYDEGIEHAGRADAAEVVYAVSGEVDGEQEDEDEDVEGLSGQGEIAAAGLVAQVVLPLVRFQQLVGLFIDDVAAADDFLSALHDLAAGRHAAYQFFAGCLAVYAVVDEVGHDEFVEVHLLQHFVVVAYDVILRQLFVGLLGGERLLHADERGILAHDAPNGLRAIVAQWLARVDNALIVEAVQPVADDDFQLPAHKHLAAPALAEEAHLLVGHVFVEDIIGLELLQHLVALLGQRLLAFIDGEVEGGRQVGIAPGRALLHLIADSHVARHEPYDGSHGDNDESRAHGNIAPRKLCPKIEIYHDVSRF